jgi:hypothetical protein
MQDFKSYFFDPLCLGPAKYPVPVVEPERVSVVIGPGEDIRVAVAVEIPHRQAVPRREPENLATVAAEIPLPVVPPDARLARPGDQSVQISIAIQIIQEDMGCLSAGEDPL